MHIDTDNKDGTVSHLLTRMSVGTSNTTKPSSTKAEAHNFNTTIASAVPRNNLSRANLQGNTTKNRHGSATKNRQFQ